MILFVHGMGFSSDRDYWKDWAVPLQNELAKQSLALKDEQFGGVYYYDLVPGPKYGKGQTEGVLQIQIMGLKKRAEEELGSLRSPYAKETGAIRKLSDSIVDSFGDIFAYLYWDKTYQEVNKRLYEAIDQSNEPVHLVGYSLGSIVSFCALVENPAAARQVSHLLLLGSPLFWFKQGVARHVDLESRPAVGRFTNIAGVMDIAWPQMVPKILPGLDRNIDFIINPFNPIKGHQEYFHREEGLQAIASEVVKGWS